MFARKSVGFQEVVWKEKPRLGDHSFGCGFFVSHFDFIVMFRMLAGLINGRSEKC